MYHFPRSLMQCQTFISHLTSIYIHHSHRVVFCQYQNENFVLFLTNIFHLVRGWSKKGSRRQGGLPAVGSLPLPTAVPKRGAAPAVSAIPARPAAVPPRRKRSPEPLWFRGLLFNRYTYSSNPHIQSQSLLCYPLHKPAMHFGPPQRTDIIIQKRWNLSTPFFIFLRATFRRARQPRARLCTRSHWPRRLSRNPSETRRSACPRTASAGPAAAWAPS